MADDKNLEKMQAAMDRLEAATEKNAFRESVLDPRFAQLLMFQTESMCLTRLVENMDRVVRDFSDTLPVLFTDGWQRRKEGYVELIDGFRCAAKMLADMQAADLERVMAADLGDVLSSSVIELPEVE